MLHFCLETLKKATRENSGTPSCHRRHFIRIKTSNPKKKQLNNPIGYNSKQTNKQLQKIKKLREINVTASTSLWETIRTPSLLTSRFPSLNVPLSVLYHITCPIYIPSIPISHNTKELKHIHMIKAREGLTGTWWKKADQMQEQWVWDWGLNILSSWLWLWLWLWDPYLVPIYF